MALSSDHVFPCTCGPWLWARWYKYRVLFLVSGLDVVCQGRVVCCSRQQAAVSNTVRQTDRRCRVWSVIEWVVDWMIGYRCGGVTDCVLFNLCKTQRRAWGAGVIVLCLGGPGIESCSEDEVYWLKLLRIIQNIPRSFVPQKSPYFSHKLCTIQCCQLLRHL